MVIIGQNNTSTKSISADTTNVFASSQTKNKPQNTADHLSIIEGNIVNHQYLESLQAYLLEGKPNSGLSNIEIKDYFGFDKLINKMKYINESPIANNISRDIDVSPQDVKQGNVGDCFLLASLASLAAVNPEALNNIISHNSDGTYTIEFYSDDPSCKKTITINDDFVNFKGAKISTNDDKGKWVALMEKAYATLFASGSLDNLNGGSPDKPLQHLTGLKYATYRQELVSFDFIKKCLEDKQPMVCSTYPTTKIQYFNNSMAEKLLDNHSYAILATRVQENGKQQICLYNPWGHAEPENDGKDDGMFWMDYKDFKSSFAHISAQPVEDFLVILSFIGFFIFLTTKNTPQQ